MCYTLALIKTNSPVHYTIDRDSRIKCIKIYLKHENTTLGVRINVIESLSETIKSLPYTMMPQDVSWDSAYAATRTATRTTTRHYSSTWRPLPR